MRSGSIMVCMKGLCLAGKDPIVWLNKKVNCRSKKRLRLYLALAIVFLI